MLRNIRGFLIIILILFSPIIVSSASAQTRVFNADIFDFRSSSDADIEFNFSGLGTDGKFYWRGGSGENYFDFPNTIQAVDINISNDLAVTGSFKLTGDQTFVGSGNGLYYGSMYTNATIATVLTTQNQWYEIDAAQAWTVGKLNGITFADPKLTTTIAGTYLIQYTVSSSINANSQEVEFGIMIDSTNTDGPAHGSAGVQTEGRTHRIMATLNDIGAQSGAAIITLAAGKTISLAARNATSASDTISVEHCNFIVTLIGG